jgi:eukaryotic-like serine/threonine-protein kinase
MSISAAPQTSEEGRAFLQQRLALFSKSAFFFYLGIAGSALLLFFAAIPDAAHHMRGPPYHLLGVLGVVTGWLVCRRGAYATSTLIAIDATITTLAGCGISGALFVGKPELFPGVLSTLGVTHLVIARAIMVPSDWRRTLWISGLAVAPTVTVVLVFGATGIGPRPEILAARLWTVWLPVWCAIAALAATWASHVIYRLRRKVAEARILGQYTLEEKIGEGGMGVVYRARHAMLRRPTVIKLLPADKAGAANLVRFEREVQHTSQLSSPHTVAVYDYGRTPEGTFYYAMEHLDGVDLDHLVKQAGPQPASRVIHLLAQACVALAEAHEAGLIHRDVKPSNIMLCRHGGAFDVVKVLDFGLVKDLGAGADATRVTHADALLGTPLYLSPEAMTDPDALDGRADLYALGAVGYYLLTGRHVFQGRTVAELCGQHMYSVPVPPSERARDVPADLEAVILSCLAKGRDERPADARALRRALLACAAAGGWSEDDARVWWQSRKEAVSVARA